MSLHQVKQDSQKSFRSVLEEFYKTDKIFTASKYARIRVREIHWLNDKILPDVYSEPSQTSEMELFMKIRSTHSEMFLKIGVTKKWAHSLKNTFGKIYFLVKLQDIKVNSLTGIFQGFC